MTSDQKIVLFDGVCNLCNGSVQFLLRQDRNAVLHFASLQSEAGQQVLDQYAPESKDLKSIVFVDSGMVYQESDAVLRISGYLGWPWKAGYYFRWVPRFIRDSVYRLIANNRYRWFGKKDQCMLPDASVAQRFL